MLDKYSPADVEQAAQAHWKAIDAYKAVENDPRFPKGKYYACSMLPSCRKKRPISSVS